VMGSPGDTPRGKRGAGTSRFSRATRSSRSARSAAGAARDPHLHVRRRRWARDLRDFGARKACAARQTALRDRTPANCR
jgi:hypothetical protein